MADGTLLAEEVVVEAAGELAGSGTVRSPRVFVLGAVSPGGAESSPLDGPLVLAQDAAHGALVPEPASLSLLAAVLGAWAVAAVLCRRRGG